VIDVDATPDALSQIEAILREEIGLDTATVGRSLVLRAAQRRIRRCAIGSIEAYADRLCADAQELQELVEEVVVPETYFFREPDAIADVARRVRDMLALPGASTPVRILSVPCSTGEEPYSIAMALLMEGLSPESVAIDAIDVSFEAVRRAREGVFGSGSFRGEIGEWKKYFRETSRGTELDESVRAFVSVDHGNLMSASFQPACDRYDVIFCRNLLIYFDEKAQARALGALTRFLARDGSLVVGAADTFAVRRAGFASLPASERSFLFQLRAVRETAPPLSARPAPRSQTRRSARVSHATKPRAIPAAISPAPSAAPVPTFEVIAHLADAGRLAEVLTRGERALRDGAASAKLLALLGTTYAAVDNDDRAEECYRQALFLDPENEDALLHLAFLLDGRGANVLGDRLRARARRALSFRPVAAQ